MTLEIQGEGVPHDVPPHFAGAPDAVPFTDIS